MKNVHFPTEGHDYGKSKRMALYDFLAKNFQLDLKKMKDKAGNIDESKVTIEPFPAMYVFGEKGENLPSNAEKSFETLEKMFEEAPKN